MRRLTLALAPAVLCPALGCGPEPVFDSNIGVEAIPVEEGAAAGVFGLKTVNTTLVQVPVLGDYQGGGVNFRLVTRSYNAESQVYEQRSRLCGGFNFEVAGVVTSAPESTYLAVAESPAERVTIDAAGAYQQTDHIQLWGLRDLPEPFDTPLPATKEEALEPPHADRIFDMDEDGEPGATTFVSGAVEGEVFIIQRKTVTTQGVVLGPDRAIGLAENTNEVVQLGNTNALLDRQSEGSAGPHPNPKLSWFEELRLDDDADCEDVMGLDADDRFSRTPPFPDDGTAQ